MFSITFVLSLVAYCNPIFTGAKIFSATTASRALCREGQWKGALGLILWTTGLYFFGVPGDFFSNSVQKKLKWLPLSGLPLALRCWRHAAAGVVFFVVKKSAKF